MPQYFVVFSFFCFLFRYFLINALRNNVNSCWKWKAYFVTVRQQIEYKIEIELSRAHCGVKESFFGGWMQPEAVKHYVLCMNDLSSDAHHLALHRPPYWRSYLHCQLHTCRLIN